jgi:hypothetical protein
MLGLALLAVVVFLVFAFIQKAAADSSMTKSEEMIQKVIMAQKMALEQRQASQQHLEAIEQTLKECQARSK